MSSRLAIKAEKVCKEGGAKIEVVTVPSHISSECGMAVRVDSENKELVSKLLSDCGIGFEIYNV